MWPVSLGDVWHQGEASEGTCPHTHTYLQGHGSVVQSFMLSGAQWKLWCSPRSVGKGSSTQQRTVNSHSNCDASMASGRREALLCQAPVIHCHAEVLLVASVAWVQSTPNRAQD